MDVTNEDSCQTQSCILVAHHESTSNSHASCPAAQDDLVLVAVRPVSDLLLAVEAVPAGDLLLVLALKLGLASTGPRGLVELDATALGLDGVKGRDDEDGAHDLKVDGKRTVGGPAAMQPEGCRDGDGKAGDGALDGPADGSGLVGLELFFGGQL